MLTPNTRDFVDASARPIKFKPKPTVDLRAHHTINKRFAGMDIAHFGGSLRNAFMGLEPRDYDFALNVAHLSKTSEFPEVHVIADFLGEEFQPREIIANEYGSILSWMPELHIFEGKIDDYECDVIATNTPLNVAEIAMSGDAAINCVAMGNDGFWYTHPNFTHDLKNNNYAPRVTCEIEMERSMMRFTNLSRKRPYLRDYKTPFPDMSLSFSPVDQ